MRIEVDKLIVFGGFFVEHEDLARHHLDRPHAENVQSGCRYPWNEAVGSDAAGGGACKLAVAGRHIVDEDRGKFVFRLDALHLAGEPFAVGRRHLGVLFRAVVVAAVKRFGGHRVGKATHFGQDFEAAVEHQLCVGEFLLESRDHRGKPRLLPRALRVGLRDQVVGVERVEEKAAKAALPERADDRLAEELGPGGLRLVDHRAVKRRIDACLPRRRDVLEIRPGGMHFTEAHIGEPRGALCRRQRPWRVVRLEHHGIECGQLVHGRRRAVKQRDRWRSGRALCHQRRGGRRQQQSKCESGEHASQHLTLSQEKQCLTYEI